MSKLKFIDSYHETDKHLYDKFTNLGYEFDNNILRNVVSPEMFANPVNDTPLRQIERMIEFLIHQVKRIKLEYNFTLPKNSKKLN